MKRCCICGRIVYPWRDTIKSEKVGTIHTSCLMVFIGKAIEKAIMSSIRTEAKKTSEVRNKK